MELWRTWCVWYLFPSAPWHKIAPPLTPGRLYRANTWLRVVRKTDQPHVRRKRAVNGPGRVGGWTVSNRPSSLLPVPLLLLLPAPGGGEALLFA